MNTQPLKKAIESIERTDGELLKLQHKLELSAAYRRERERVCDIESKSDLVEIGRLQILTGLLPTRVEAAAEAASAAQQECLEVAGCFIRETLSPELRNLLGRAQEKARDTLRPHFAQADALDSAVEQSEIVAAIRALQPRVVISRNPWEGIPRYMQGLLDVCRKTEALAAKLDAQAAVTPANLPAVSKDS